MTLFSLIRRAFGLAVRKHVELVDGLLEAQQAIQVHPEVRDDGVVHQHLPRLDRGHQPYGSQGHSGYSGLGSAARYAIEEDKGGVRARQPSDSAMSGWDGFGGRGYQASGTLGALGGRKGDFIACTHGGKTFVRWWDEETKSFLPSVEYTPDGEKSP